MSKIISENFNENDLQLFTKLSELRMIFSVYDTLSENIGIDKRDEMSRLARELSEYDFFDGTSIFIDGFYGFSAPEVSIIKQLILQADNVSISAVCTKEAFYDKNADLGYFSDSFGLIKKLTSFCVGEETGTCQSRKIDPPKQTSRGSRSEADEIRVPEKQTK